MKKRFNKNGLITSYVNEHDKQVRIRYYKNEIVMYFETGIVYRYKFKAGSTLEYKYINDVLVGCTIFEGKSKEDIIQEIQESHATESNPNDKITRPEKQKTFFEAIKEFLESI